jgi:hypothetical protein
MPASRSVKTSSDSELGLKQEIMLRGTGDIGKLLHTDLNFLLILTTTGAVSPANNSRTCVSTSRAKITMDPASTAGIS